jgi:DNA-binding NtrC family response regulator
MINNKDPLYKIENMSGYSDKYLFLINSIKNIVESGVDTINKKKTLKPILIFLYSEPGCGKENLAKIIHLLSFRTGCDDTLKNTFKEQEKRNKLIYEKFINVLKKDPKFEEWNKYKNFTSKKFISSLFFNYYTFVCNDLTEENFTKIFLGCLTKENSSCGLLLKAHLLGGTIFLDEFNTLNPIVANKLLRIFEEPYEINIEGFNEPINLNLMIIFASNMNREELIRKKFNPAIVYRITQNYFNIPPLRERPEDIAVFINNQILRYNGTLKNDKISNIDLHALRLICELPWFDNYRGLKGLIDDIFADRKKREIRSKFITFDEVLDSLKRRGIFGEKGWQIKNEND